MYAYQRVSAWIFLDQSKKDKELELLCFGPNPCLHISCPTRGNNILDLVYTNIAEAYKAISLPHLGQSDHLSPDVFGQTGAYLLPRALWTPTWTLTHTFLLFLTILKHASTMSQPTNRSRPEALDEQRGYRLLLKACDAAFRSSSSRANLKKGHQECKEKTQMLIEEHFKNNPTPDEFGMRHLDHHRLQKSEHNRPSQWYLPSWQATQQLLCSFWPGQ